MRPVHRLNINLWIPITVIQDNSISGM